jgi:hypothetical protein
MHANPCTFTLSLINISISLHPYTFAARLCPQERAAATRAREEVTALQQMRVAALKRAREVLAADLQTLVDAVLTDGAQPLFLSSLASSSSSASASVSSSSSASSYFSSSSSSSSSPLSLTPEALEQLQAIVLRLQSDHARQLHDAQRETERLRYACADQVCECAACVSVWLERIC